MCHKIFRQLFAIISLTLIFGLRTYANEELVRRDYKGFTLWLDCKAHHGAVAFKYELGRDKGHFSGKRDRFDYDRKVPTSCQPQSWRSYRTTTVNSNDGTWDRGQLVSPNHMDIDRSTMKETYYLTNTLPQSSAFNQVGGAWHRTEMITECYRDISALVVIGGVIWGNQTDNDFFTVTHGIKTPDFWWKLIYRKDKKEYVAWLFPNRRSAQASNMDNFLVSIKRLKLAVDFMPDIDFIESADLESHASLISWPVELSEKELSCEGHTTSPE